MFLRLFQHLAVHYSRCGRSCPAPPPSTDSCLTTPQADYATYCGVLKNATGPFGSCIAQLDTLVPGTSTVLYNDCILDACMSDGLELCSNVWSLVDECADLGFQIDCDLWQSATNCRKYKLQFTYELLVPLLLS